ncbi:MAG: hypothetical protein JO222_05540 [Frankiales bacterium]|nr:hypothetical protein [Frankiales bacterium]
MRRLLTVVAAAGVLVTGLSTTSTAVPGDRPDTLRAARHAGVSPNGPWIAETLESTSDQDFFRFTMGTAGHALVTLGRLPGNYALDLYRADGHLVASSDRGGHRFEQLYVALPAADYYVRVSSAHGVDPHQAYRLQFRPLSAAVVFAEFKDVAHGHGIDVRGELLNNTPHRVDIVRLHVRYFDKHGQQIGTSDEGIRPGPIAAWHRAEFEVKHSDAELPTGTTSYRIRVDAVRSHAPVLRGAKVKPGTTTQVSPTRRAYSGTVTNTTNQTINNVWVTVIEYDSKARANVIGFDHIDAIAPGATTPYNVVDRYSSAPNATRVYATIYG